MRSATIGRVRRTTASAAAALWVAGALAGCGRTGAQPDAPPPPPPPAEEPLAGAPDAAPPPVADVREAPPAPPGAAPAPDGDAAPTAPMEAPSAAPEGLVAMAPIPNPPETTPPVRHRLHRHRRWSHRHYARGEAYASYGAKAYAPRLRARPYAQAPTRPALRHAAASARPAQAVPTHHHAHRHAPARAAAAATTGVDRAAALQAVQTALAAEIARTAVLTPPSARPGVATDVVLTVPASLAEALRTEAGRQGLADDAASAALIARLAGPGYTVLPEGEQRQMISAGAPTVFHWTATAQPGARGPLQVDVAAQLLGGAAQDRLDLGQVAAARADDGLGWRMLGAAILALLVGGAVALLARSRRRPARRADDGVIRRREPFTLRDDDRPHA